MDVFEAIADPTRRRLMELLAEREHQAGELAMHFDISFPAISQQLRILSDAHLVEARREGRFRVYRMRPESLDPVADWLTTYADKFWRRRLKGLGQTLARLKHES